MKNHNSWVKCWRAFIMDSHSWCFGLTGGGRSLAFNNRGGFSGTNIKRSFHWIGRI